MTLDIAYLNGYVGNKTPARAVRRMLKGRPDSVGWGEGYHNVRNNLFTKFGRYRVFHASAVGLQDIRGAHDTPILTLKRHKNRGEVALQASEPSTPLKIAPARWITASVYDHPMGRVAHVNIHPNAAVQGGTRQSDRVREYAHSMVTLGRLIDLFQWMGHLVVVTGDLNWRERGDDRDWTPEQIFKARGLETVWKGLDCIAFDVKTLAVVSSVDVPTSQTGSDHPGLIVKFKAASKRS